MSFQITKLIAKVFLPFKRIPYLPILIDEQVKVFTLFFRPKVFENMIEIVRSIRKLPNIQSKYHKYGGLEFTINNKEICHIHGDGLVDILLTRSITSQLISTTEAEEHHIIKRSGWLSYQIKNDTDIVELMDIIEQSYQQKRNQ